MAIEEFPLGLTALRATGPFLATRSRAETGDDVVHSGGLTPIAFEPCFATIAWFCEKTRKGLSALGRKRMFRHFARPLALAAACLLAAPAGAVDLAKGRQTLPDLVLGGDNGQDYDVSQKDYELESGKAYQLDIVSKGGKEYKFFSPEFFRNIWINQIVINHLEIHGPGSPHHLEWDDEGAIRLEFVVIRPGKFKWWIDGLEERGMTGTIAAK